MVDDENIELLNLFVDESGTPALGINPHRYFLLTSVIMTPDQQELACLLLAAWRKKYLNNPTKSIHTADFFEDFEDGYRKPELRIERHFVSAIDNLMDVFRHVQFYTKVYYVDLKQLRKRLGVKNVPEYKVVQDFKDDVEKKDYQKKRKIFEKYMIDAHEGNLDKPYIFPLFKILELHNELLETGEKEDPFKRKFRGFVHFESLSGADIKAIKYFHKFKDIINPKYQFKVVGINFPTKNSLDGGIEIADIISYVSCQNLRFSHKLYGELKTIPDYRKKQLKRMRRFMRTNLKVELVNVTDFSIPKLPKPNNKKS